MLNIFIKPKYYRKKNVTTAFSNYQKIPRYSETLARLESKNIRDVLREWKENCDREREHCMYLYIYLNDVIVEFNSNFQVQFHEGSRVIFWDVLKIFMWYKMLLFSFFITGQNIQMVWDCVLHVLLLLLLRFFRICRATVHVDQWVDGMSSSLLHHILWLSTWTLKKVSAKKRSFKGCALQTNSSCSSTFISVHPPFSPRSWGS